jgi:hypothetical protein
MSLTTTSGEPVNVPSTSRSPAGSASLQVAVAVTGVPKPGPPLGAADGEAAGEYAGDAAGLAAADTAGFGEGRVAPVPELQATIKTRAETRAGFIADGSMPRSDPLVKGRLE